MKFLIPIPSFLVFFPIIFLLFCLGSFTISSLLYRKVTVSFSLNRLQVNNIWNGMLTLFGISFISISQLFLLSFEKLLLFLFFGFFFAYLMFKIELKLNRILFRKRTIFNQKKFHEQNSFLGEIQRNPKMLYLMGKKTSDPDPLGIEQNKNPNEQDNFNYNLRDLVICAILEEIVYRGFLIITMYQLIPNLFLGITISSVFFGVMHLSFGWHQWLSKTVMGIVLGFSVYLCKSLYPALFGHVFFNLFISLYIKSRKEHGWNYSI